ncbi:dihydrodipicolinate synthase family protein [Lederbergia sp. NSJ-179]|uniref:dihydrodipicolinate synthase family protein n=1 Tax=Lederbergia sp. NSJ-179 TaxID=2931402 RepID=UPI001FD4C28D|nr:dihydrodipicolinate synthase family protein [Lederbergia sp. NSJ-179]MCJ7841218.1 dihydrodipicolinate synthase family protein [Lederbergia sp. NSJ-179]
MANTLTQDKQHALRDGIAIPAHPLALTSERQLDKRRQRALVRYYMAAGAGGIAVGVHTTQFEIRKKGIDLYEPVLRIAAEEVARAGNTQSFVKVAGICGPTEQAIKEAEVAAEYEYDLGLVSLGGISDQSEKELLQHVRHISEIIPIFGFYLQPAVGGRLLSYQFWKEFSEIPNVMAIKIAPFNRYQTLDVARAVCQSNRKDDIALFTGNDDNIIADLLTTYRFNIDGKQIEKPIVGGLLGHWAVWTEKAVEFFGRVKAARKDGAILSDLLSLGTEITDSNAALFDAPNHFAGCIPGIHEVLRRQGLLEGRWCLNPAEKLSEGQITEIDRIYRDYPHLNDDRFVRKHLNQWMND